MYDRSSQVEKSEKAVSTHEILGDKWDSKITKECWQERAQMGTTKQPRKNGFRTKAWRACERKEGQETRGLGLT